jgi:hypothetical protein
MWLHDVIECIYNVNSLMFDCRVYDYDCVDYICQHLSYLLSHKLTVALLCSLKQLLLTAT